MRYPKIFVGLAVIGSIVATPALAGAEKLSIAKSGVSGSAQDVRANTKGRKSSKLTAEATVVSLLAAAAAAAGIAAAAGAFESDGIPDSN